LLFQYDVPWPVVDENVTGTLTKPAPGELIVSAMAAAGIKIAAAKIPNVFMFPPIRLASAGCPKTVWQLL
jgi:hypothetical protein